VTSNEDVVDELTQDRLARAKIRAVQQQFGLSKSQIKKTKAIFDLLDFDGSRQLDIVELQLALEQAHVSMTRKSAIRMMQNIDPTWRESDCAGIDFPSFLRFFITVSECRQSGQPTLPQLLAGFRIVGFLRERVRDRKERCALAMKVLV
jgi:Ca2+-binding EF-hand superfamily protein